MEIRLPPIFLNLKPLLRAMGIRSGQLKAGRNLHFCHLRTSKHLPRFTSRFFPLWKLRWLWKTHQLSRCISYWKLFFSNVMLVNSGVYFTRLPEFLSRHYGIHTSLYRYIKRFFHPCHQTFQVPNIHKIGRILSYFSCIDTAYGFGKPSTVP